MKKRYVFDFETDSTCPKPIPIRKDGVPAVHTAIFSGVWAPCCAEKPCPLAGWFLEPNGTPFQNRHAIRATVVDGVPVANEFAIPTGDVIARDEEVRFGEIIEADLDDDSYRSFQIRRHLTQGRCRELAEPKEA